MMCQMQKNAESFGAILQVSEKCITEAEWLKDLKRDRERVSISVEKIRKQCRKIPNWKAPKERQRPRILD